MKILMISEYFPPVGKGGGEISAYLLAKHLVKNKITVHVLTSHFDNLKRIETVDGIKIHRFLQTGKNPSIFKDNIKRILKFEKSLLKETLLLSEKENYDVIHCMNTSSIPTVKLKHIIKKPFILHVNGPVMFCPKGTLMYKDEIPCNIECNTQNFTTCFLSSKNIGKTNLKPYLKYNPLLMYLLKKRYNSMQQYMKLFDRFFAISTYMKTRLLMSGINEAEIDIVYNITETKDFINLKQKKNKILKILYLGEYSKPKGPHIIIDALKKLKINYEANFYGKGVLEDYMLQEKILYNLNINVNNIVPYDFVPKIIEEHDIVIFPSFVGEAFGRVALESCYAGKTVLASNIGGVKDIIDEGKTGYLFVPGDSDKLAELIKMCRTNRLKPESVRKLTLQKFSNETTIKQVKKIYTSFL